MDLEIARITSRGGEHLDNRLRRCEHLTPPKTDAQMLFLRFCVTLILFANLTGDHQPLYTESERLISESDTQLLKLVFITRTHARGFPTPLARLPVLAGNATATDGQARARTLAAISTV